MTDGRGGPRPGAGRPPKAPAKLNITADDPLDFLLAVMQDQEADAELRVKAALKAVDYTHAKTGGVGKKGERQKAAKAAAAGRFAPAAPPKLKVVGGA